MTVVLVSLAGIAILDGFVLTGYFFYGGALMAAALAALSSGFEFSFFVLWAAMTGGAIVGDNASFWFGRMFHDRFDAAVEQSETWRNRWRRANRLCERYGAIAATLGRFWALTRPIVPAVLGATEMRWNRFLAANAIGCGVWVAVWLAIAIQIHRAI